jgi:hypothetical protein
MTLALVESSVYCDFVIGSNEKLASAKSKVAMKSWLGKGEVDVSGGRWRECAVYGGFNEGKENKTAAEVVRRGGRTRRKSLIVCKGWRAGRASY